MGLDALGWNTDFEKEFAPFRKKGWVPARLFQENKTTYGAMVEGGERHEVVLSGKVYHDAETDAELPIVGDWVAIQLGSEGQKHVIRARLQRRSCLSRKVPGKSTEEQAMVANVDTVAVVTDAGVDFNERRIERYLIIIKRSGATPVILINKSDLYSEAEKGAALERVRKLGSDIAVHLISAKNEVGLKVLQSYLKVGATLSLIGSSGVGKSTLTNQLLGEDWQWTNEVNEVTEKGRHSTIARELIVLPQGGVLIDNPGIREVQMWTDAQTLRENFADLEALAKQCKFKGCKHGTEAGCAIHAALERGDLDEARYQSFLNLEHEIERLRRRRKKRQMNVEKISKEKYKAKNRRDNKRIDLRYLD